MAVGGGRGEQELARVAARDAFRVRITDLFRDLSDPAQIREAACRLLAEHLDVGRALYARVEGNAYIVELEHCRGVTALGQQHRFVSGSYGGKVYDATLAGRLLVVADVREHPLTAEHSAAYEAIETRSYISVPLIRTGQWVGTFAVNAPVPRQWTTDEIELVADIGERTWYAVERARGELELQRSAARDAYRLRLADALRRSKLPEECRQVACRLLAEQLGANRTVYAVLDDNHYVVEHDHCAGVRSMIGRYPLSRFGRAISDVLLGGDVIWSDDIFVDERLTDEVRDAIAAIEVRSFITVPTLKHGVWVGAVAVHSTLPRGWTAEERELTVETAERAWFAVERARNEIEVTRAAARDAYRIRLADALRSQTDPVAIRHAATQLYGEYTGANRVLFAQIVGHESIIDPEYVDGLPSIAGRWPYAAYGNKAISSLRAGDLFILHDAEAELAEPELAAYRAIGIRAGIAVGLVKDGTWVGSFAAHSTIPRTWSADELALLRETAERTWAEMERARAEAALRESEAALREADRRKDEFLAMLAHELRNPLSPLRTVASVLQLAQSKPDVIEEMRLMLDRQVAHMTRLVDDLLDAARMTRGTITLRRAPTSLRALVLNAIEAHRATVEAAGIALHVGMPDIDCTVDVDATRIVQVLSNLLHNATKFTPPGGRITVAARVDGYGVVLAVADTGEGISADIVPHVFELFRLGGVPGGRRHGGLGVGLALARTLVELHGGTIRVRSDGAGKGTHVEVNLPDIVADTTPHAAVATNHGGRPRRVLIIDDNADAARSLALLIDAMGGAAEVARDGTAGIERARELHPDLVLLDLGMPGLDGFETCRRLRGELGADVQIIAVTGWGKDEDKRRAHEAGFDAHITKPPDPVLLRGYLER